MNLILLGGQSLYNKDWIERVDKKVSDLFHKTDILYYEHWKNGKDIIDVGMELPKLVSLAPSLKPYSIFAKSMGAVLTVRGVWKKELSPTACVFIAPAFLPEEEETTDFAACLEGFSTRSVFLAKTDDPVAPAKELHELLEKRQVKNYEFIEIPGDNHKYEDLDQLRDLTKRLTGQC